MRGQSIILLLLSHATSASLNPLDFLFNESLRDEPLYMTITTAFWCLESIEGQAEAKSAC